jgi:hypothetical protein
MSLKASYCRNSLSIGKGVFGKLLGAPNTEINFVDAGARMKF